MPILVVEDEALLLMMLCEEFEDAGMDVIAASSAQQALELLRARGSDGVAVLITDLNLGPGLDGVALADAVRSLSPGVVVVYATGNASWLRERSTALQPGDRLFSKPYDLADLVGTVCAAVSSEAAAGRAGGAAPGRFGSR